jgi:hypothetical protein
MIATHQLQRNLQLQLNELLVAISIRPITTNMHIFYVRSLIVYISVTRYVSYCNWITLIIATRGVHRCELK